MKPNTWMRPTLWLAAVGLGLSAMFAPTAEAQELLPFASNSGPLLALAPADGQREGGAGEEAGKEESRGGLSKEELSKLAQNPVANLTPIINQPSPGPGVRSAFGLCDINPSLFLSPDWQLRAQLHVLLPQEIFSRK
jgi:hypothetical protein